MKDLNNSTPSENPPKPLPVEYTPEELKTVIKILEDNGNIPPADTNKT